MAPSKNGDVPELRQSLSHHSGISQKSESTTSGVRPSSVYLGGPPIVRELSDLSGSYMGGSSTNGSKSGVPNHIYDQSHIRGPWRQAYVLSKNPTAVPSTPASGSGGDTEEAMIFTDHGGVVEVMTRSEGDSQHIPQANHHKRIPIIILLMDPTQKSYEMVQLWIDKTLDSVRDVLHAMQQSIPDVWKQAYDGLFQMRGDKFSQLINILCVEKYEILPHEVWVARPWAMSAKVTTSFAESAASYLMQIGVFCRTMDEKKKGDDRLPRSKAAESVLMLSKVAQERIFVPEGIMNHHHAFQFLSFSPPLDNTTLPVHLLINRKDEPASNDQNDSRDSEHITTKRDTLPNMSSLSLNSVSMSESQRPPRNSLSTVGRNETVASSSLSLQDCESYKAEKKTSFLSQIVSKLKCKRVKDKPKYMQRQRQPQPGDFSAAAPAVQERKWSTFDITSPIAEDQSNASQSEVSMSAPLLLRRCATGVPRHPK